MSLRYDQSCIKHINASTCTSLFSINEMKLQWNEELCSNLPPVSTNLDLLPIRFREVIGKPFFFSVLTTYNKLNLDTEVKYSAHLLLCVPREFFHP